MSTPRTVLVLLAALTALVVPTTAGAAGLSQSERSLLKEINHVRAGYGLHALSYDAKLTVAARAHSRAMAAANVFTHGDFQSRMVQFKVTGPYLGENLAYGSGPYGSPKGIVNAWLNSPGHRENLLRPGFRRIGLGQLTTQFMGVPGASVVTADFAGF